jgi:hypothetical protein
MRSTLGPTNDVAMTRQFRLAAVIVGKTMNTTNVNQLGNAIRIDDDKLSLQVTVAPRGDEE